MKGEVIALCLLLQRIGHLTVFNNFGYLVSRLWISLGPLLAHNKGHAIQIFHSRDKKTCLTKSCCGFDFQNKVSNDSKGYKTKRPPQIFIIYNPLPENDWSSNLQSCCLLQSSNLQGQKLTYFLDFTAKFRLEPRQCIDWTTLASECWWSKKASAIHRQHHLPLVKSTHFCELNFTPG